MLDFIRQLLRQTAAVVVDRVFDALHKLSDELQTRIEARLSTSLLPA
jgi:hypothetical protein